MTDQEQSGGVPARGAKPKDKVKKAAYGVVRHVAPPASAPALHHGFASAPVSAQSRVSAAPASTRMDLDELTRLMDELSTRKQPKQKRGSRDIKMTTAASRATSRANAGRRAVTLAEEQAASSSRQKKPSAKQLLKAYQKQANAKWNTNIVERIENAKDAIKIQEEIVEKAAAALKQQESVLSKLQDTLSVLEDNQRTGKGQMDIIREGGAK